jgi:hypothetical protein
VLNGAGQEHLDGHVRFESLDLPRGLVMVRWRRGISKRRAPERQRLCTCTHAIAIAICMVPASH